MLTSEIPILGLPTDYYEEIKTNSGSVVYKANRNKIRELLSFRKEFIDTSIAGGTDEMQAAMNWLDLLDIFLLNEPIEAKTDIYEVLTQELNIITQQLDNKTNEIYQKINEEEATAESIGKWIGAGILLIFILFVFVSTR
ncbi:hypothetical protein PSI23_03240 [Xenorhabdus sp. XENO-10]|uniref:Uncharacterized protein n=1 Tax=Xenorhabdus yunnanensis TaxID=3025878 RepID=A0ABT5LBB0_9GAMM|nr:hypothetical protein [Xenorhabdus yunnanensis]MDC9588355.1 hypothetical protein [Xenorhabdus yunnanensis]